ncbi:hypothetical protein BIV57_20575 [Mangrovactinospora gilvigrisea]|uniref:Thiopeptide-type bacteriocin biosynthesis domain-containing protein n=2 Tax=Mangrovactinospora gilvigrisea TaxID=1428644 RepID=A0A1J7BAJ0_9ACTN|nr:hypothetical protein BIV57_20575 [Mangrovactinospora gilvigrisea]
MLGDFELATYYPETGRYGGPSAMQAAEDFFAADTRAALAQVALCARPDGLDPRVLCAASMADLAAAFTGSTGAGMRWLIGHIAAEGAPTVPHGLHRQARGLPAPAAWTARRAAVRAYRAMAPDDVLPSLLHMHHNRVLGTDRDNENACYRLARSIALAWTARRTGERDDDDR